MESREKGQQEKGNPRPTLSFSLGWWKHRLSGLAEKVEMRGDRPRPHATPWARGWRAGASNPLPLIPNLLLPLILEKL